MSTGADIGLTAIAHSLPARTVESAEIAAKHGFDPAFIAEKLGISARRVAGEGETTATLAADAVHRVLEASETDPAAVEALILVTQTPDYMLPHSAALVQAAAGLPQSVAAFDVSLGCSGFVYGLNIARGFMAANGFTTGLLVTAETYSRLMAEDDRATQPLFGDGAAAALLTADPLYRLGAATYGTDGARAEALIAHGTGAKPEDRRPLFMDGRAIFTFMMSEIPKDVDRCLEANGIEKDAVDCWVFHQASRYMLDSLAKRLGVLADKVVVDIEDIGNTTSSSIPFALERRVFNRTPPPKTVFLSGFGVGLSWASTVLTRA